jgi:uncharacterized membrane protein YkoI
MLRPSASPRRVLGFALVVSVGAGIGLGTPSLLSASDTPQVPRAQAAATTTTTATTAPTATTATTAPTATTATTAPTATTATTAPTATTVPAPAEAPAPSPLTLEEAKAVAAQVAPGRVIEWDQDNEPTGLRFDVKLLHDDGSTTEVEVDALTRQVTSIDHDNDLD